MISDIRERVSVGGQAFTFKLCRKAERLGPVAVDHWWMRTSELYRQRAQRPRRGGNYEALTEAFWALCRRGGSHAERDVQESYLLARLLPSARSQGSRRVVADACLAPRTSAARAGREAAVHELDELLRGCPTASMTPLEFSRRTADVIGPPVPAAGLEEAYRACCSELFDPAVAALAAGKEAGVERLLAGWGRLMRSVGRHGGRPLEKQVLDILPHLSRSYQLSPESVAFLRLWHLDQASESDLGEAAHFHLFHGHAFALHPASALFLSTPAGRELVGGWLSAGRSDGAFGRLLHGVLVAVHHYAGLRDEAAQRRRKQPLGLGGPELVNLEEQLSGRRRRRPRGG
jgi:hypothetical protein